MTHNEDKNQLIETDLEITVIVIIFCLFKKVEERAMGYGKKIQIKYLYLKTIMSWINIIYPEWD